MLVTNHLHKLYTRGKIMGSFDSTNTSYSFYRLTFQCKVCLWSILNTLNYSRNAIIKYSIIGLCVIEHSPTHVLLTTLPLLVTAVVRTQLTHFNCNMQSHMTGRWCCDTPPSVSPYTNGIQCALIRSTWYIM
jgi:hypothetical protein